MLRSSTYNFLGFFIQILVVFGSYPFLLRGLGEELVGIFFLANTLVLVWSFFDFGVSYAVVQKISMYLAKEEHRQASDIAISAIAYYVFLGIGISLGLWAGAPQISALFGVTGDHASLTEYCIAMTGIRFGFFFMAHVALSALKGLKIYSYNMTLTSLLSLVTFGGSAAAVYFFDAGLENVVEIALAGNILVAALAIFVLTIEARRASWPIFEGRFRWRALFEAQKFGSFIALLTLANTGTGHIQRFIVANAIGLSAVASFSIATTVSQRIQQTMHTLAEVLTPFSAEDMHNNARSKVRRTYVVSTLLMGTLSTLGAVLLYLIAPWLMSTWLNSPISGAVAELVKILCFGLAAMGFALPGYHILVGLGRPEVNTIFMAIIPVVFFSLFGFTYYSDQTTLATITGAYSVALVSYAAAFLVYLELFYWPHFRR